MTICKPGQGFYSIQELQSLWPNLVEANQKVRLSLDFRAGWPNNDLIWNQLCNFVKTISSQIHAFSTPLSPEVDDNQWANLLQQLPSGLHELSITIVKETPLAFRQITQSLSKLQKLVVCHGDGCPVFLPREKLPGLMESLPMLRKLTLWNLPEMKYQTSWNDLVRAIQSLERLEEANIFQGYARYGRVAIPLSDSEMEAIQFRPRLNEAIRAATGDGLLPKSLNEFVTAVVAVKDRVDCLDYLFSTVDPALYAPAAMESLKVQPCCK